MDQDTNIAVVETTETFEMRDSGREIFVIKGRIFTSRDEALNTLEAERER